MEGRGHGPLDSHAFTKNFKPTSDGHHRIDNCFQEEEEEEGFNMEEEVSKWAHI